MSVYPQTEPITNDQDPRIQNPPGWGDIEDLGITTWQVIESSADAYSLGGYNFTAAQDFKRILTSTKRDLIKDSVALPGVFNIPICALDNTYGWTPTLDSFFYSLAGPGAILDNNDHGQQPPFCYCVGVKDRFGKSFDDHVDLQQWHGYPWCNYGLNKPDGPPLTTTVSIPPSTPPGTGGRATAMAKDEL